MLSPPIVSLLILFALGYICVLLWHVVYSAILSPLSKIPAAHPLAAWSPLWILRKRLTVGENKAILQAHRKLGEIVRLGPNELSVNSLEGLRAVYVGNFDKHPWFKVLMVDGVTNALSSLDNRSHAESRRLFTHVYSKSHVQNSSELEAIFDEVLLHRAKPELVLAATKRSHVNVISFMAAITYDVITAYIFGIQAGSNLIGDVQRRKQILESHRAPLPYGSLLGELSGLLEGLQKLGINWVDPSIYQKADVATRFIKDMMKTAASITTSKAIVYEYASQAYNKSQFSLPKDAKLTAELFDQVFAGFETMSTTLVYLIYEMSRNVHMQDRLRTELHTLTSNRTLPKAREIDQLPLLDAIVQETIRRYAAAPTPLPRVVPEAGVHLHGYNIPGGVRISSNAYTLHRNEKVFPEPDMWNPDRWLNCSDLQLKEMRKWSWGFGSGARMCFGVHFALQELKYVTALIYGEFTTSTIEVGDMTQTDGISGRPAGDKLTIDVQFV